MTQRELNKKMVAIAQGIDLRLANNIRHAETGRYLVARQYLTPRSSRARRGYKVLVCVSVLVEPTCLFSG